MESRLEPVRLDSFARVDGMSTFHFIRQVEALFGLAQSGIAELVALQRAAVA